QKCDSARTNQKSRSRTSRPVIQRCLLIRTPPNVQTEGCIPLRNYNNPSTSPYRNSDCRFRRIGPQCKCPSLINSANCCGDLSRIRRPSDSTYATNSGAVMIVLMTLFKCSTYSGGVPAGATTPSHVSLSMFG